MGILCSTDGLSALRMTLTKQVDLSGNAFNLYLGGA
jgi:hypothetical protein